MNSAKDVATVAPEASDKAEAGLMETVALLSDEQAEAALRKAKEGAPPYFKRIESYPCTTCCCAFLCYVVMLVIMGALTAAGVTILEFSTAVPMYLRDHESYMAQSAVIEASSIASASININEQDTTMERELSDFTLEVIYEHKSDDGNLLSEDVLTKIREFERGVLENSKYGQYCAKNYQVNTTLSCATGESQTLDLGCQRHTSAVHFYDPAWWLPAMGQVSVDSFPSSGNTLVAGQSRLWQQSVESLDSFDDADFTASNMGTITDYWAAFSSSPFQYTQLNSTVLQCQGTAVATGVNASAPNYFWLVSSTAFGSSPEAKTAKALRSVFYLGTPRRDSGGELYDVIGDDLLTQESEVGEWLYESFQEKFEKGLSGLPVNVYWEGTGMEDAYTAVRLVESFAFIAGSFIFVLLYLTAQTQSLFIAVAAMTMILGCFIPAILLYRFVFGYAYFGTLNLLGVFVILGIGVDDVFVFMDTWNAMCVAHPKLPFRERLDHTLRHAGKAMLTTSASTTFSFLANATSEFPAVRTFGIFCACLVICNFFSVCIVFPRVVAVYEYYVGKDATWYSCFACPMKGRSQWGYPNLGEAQPESGKMELFFRDVFYPKVIDGPNGINSKVILVLFFGLTLYYIFGGLLLLEPDPEVPKLFPDTDNYVVFPKKKAANFAREENPFRVKVQIPFGIKSFDNSKCGDTACDVTVLTDYGTIEWDETIMETYQSPYVQKWFLDFCEDMQSGTEGHSAVDRKVFPTGSNVARPVKCFWQAFKEWCDDNDCPRTFSERFARPGEYIVDEAYFEEYMKKWLADDQSPADPDYVAGRQNRDVWSNYIFAEDVGGVLVLRFIIVEATLSALLTLDPQDGMALYNVWTEWLDSWTSRSQRFEYNFQTNLHYAFVSDSRAFAYFFLQDRIVQEATSGIVLSLFLAFLVLCAATGNWILSVIAVGVILTMVMGVTWFTVLNGWKLGVIEAVLYVMVIGLSVDYCTHLCEAYLASSGRTRGERVREMLFQMGVSVISGAISTLGASFFLLFPYSTFFVKFGAFVFFVICQSVIFSLFLFSAILNVVGPQPAEYGHEIFLSSKVVMHPDLHEHVRALLSKDGGLVEVALDNVAKVVQLEEGKDVVTIECRSSMGFKTVEADKNLLRKRSQTGDIDWVIDMIHAIKKTIHRRHEEYSKWLLAKDTVVLADVYQQLKKENRSNFI